MQTKLECQPNLPHRETQCGNKRLDKLFLTRRYEIRDQANRRTPYDADKSHHLEAMESTEEKRVGIEETWRV